MRNILQYTENSIKDDEKSFLYLKKDNSYTLDFKDNTGNKMLKLSTKTLNSKIYVLI